MARIDRTKGWDDRVRSVLLILSSTLAAQAAGPVKSDGSDIGLTIMGSIVQKTSEDNVALIKESGGTVKAVKKDYIIKDRYKVVAVYPDYLDLIDRDGKTYHVYSDKFASEISKKNAETPPSSTVHLGEVPEVFREDGFERVKGKITMTALYRDKLVKEDLAKILMQATAEPYMENGQIVGFKMSQIDEGSIYNKAGVANDDIITSINGQDLSSVAGTIQLLQSLKGADSVELELRRGGQTLKLNAEVK